MNKVLLAFIAAFCVSCSTHQGPSHRGVASEREWGFLVMSDIHVFTKTPARLKREGGRNLPPNFGKLLEKLVPYVDEHNIKFIVINGDSTGGNEGDPHTLATVKSWWDELKLAFEPLMRKGVRILPVTGNHDYYTENHRQGYKYAWNLFMEGISSDGEYGVTAPSPTHYIVNHGGVELFILHAVNYDLGEEQERWLSQVTQASKDNGKIKLAFGHYALYTRLIDRPFAKFGDKVRKILEDGNVYHYIAGHEHYFWDEYVGGHNFRQTITGTSSGTYNYFPRPVHANRFCKGRICEMVPDHNRFAIQGNKQAHGQMFLHIKVDEAMKSYKLKPKAFSKGEIVPFTLP